MQKYFLEFSQTGILPSLILDYLSNDKGLSKFYSYRPEISAFEKVIEQKQKEKVNRKILVEVLHDQYASVFNNNFEFNTNVKSNIELLISENTFTVTTGHQLNIFTGPLYFFYKIISTINLSEKLKQQYPHYNFIPVYWMASEDHDLEEINHIQLFGKKIIWNQDQKGACGRISTASLTTVIKELKLLTGDNKNASEIIRLFEDAYLKNKKLSDATRYLVHHLFSKYSLVIIDGDDKKLKTEFAEILEDDLKNKSAFKIVNETVTHLGKKYKTQVNPREINLFYLKDGIRGRIVFESSKFKVQDSTMKFSEREIIEELKKHPENFSPNVVLRPLYQEKVLPNLAYVGGPGEIGYWLEYKAMFDYYKINFPVLMLRNTVLWLENSTVSRMNKFSLAAGDLFQPEDVLIKNFVKKNSEDAISLKQEITEVEKSFESIKRKADQSDQSILTSIEGEKQKTLNIFNNLEAKLIRAEKKKQETNINQIRKLHEKIFPETSFQERYDNFIPYYLKYGEIFLKVLKENLDPFDFRLVVLGEN